MEGRATDAAADVNDLHSGLQPQHARELLRRVEAAGADERVTEDSLVPEDSIPVTIFIKNCNFTF
jgi:hypothetical protein